MKNTTQLAALQEITIIIPTYNRPKLLARLLNYYATKKTTAQFLVLDSSNDENKKLNESATEVLANQVRYYSFPSTLPVAEKLLEGIKQVNTPFCAFCADDDVLFVDGVAEALNFLKNNPDYVCADGIYLNFNEVGHDIQLTVEYASNGINADNPGARVFKLYQKYESLFYGVFRTEHALDIFTGVSKNSSLHYQELFQSTSALLVGKNQRLPIFYAGRQNCNPADMNRDKWQTYYWFAENPKEFIDHYSSYRCGLWDFYQKYNQQNHSKMEFDKLMDIAHAMYFGVGCPPAYFHSVLQSQWSFGEYKKPNVFFDNVMSKLKNPRRVWLEDFVDRLCVWLPKKLASFNSKRHLKSLDKEVHKNSDIKWNCKPGVDLMWMTSVDVFRDAYRELCWYMNSSKT